MATRPCENCGQELDAEAKFCGQCGTVVETNRGAPSAGARTLLIVPQTGGAPMAPAGASAVGKRTIVGLPSLSGDSSPPAASPAGKRTMVGLAAPSSDPPPMPAGGAPAESAATGSSALATTGQSASPGALRRTMLGVAMPGIAPQQSDAPPPPPVDPGATLAAPSPPMSFRRETRRAMSETVPIPAFFVPPPAPMPEMAPPSLPRAARRGAPLFVAALIAGGVALVGGGAIVLFWRSSPPISAQPRIAPDGKDVLHLTCDLRSCGDGTTATLDGAKASFLAGEADLPLHHALHVGDNVLALSIDRPGMGRDETVKLVVPVAYRVRADVATMDSRHPSITIRVEAPPGTDVRVEDKPVVLDATGAGSYVVDESAATDGPADESRVIALDAPYVVVPRGHPPENGTVSARIAVAPLRVDAPGSATTTDEDTMVIAGRAARGASATVNGVTVPVGADGSFETTVSVESPGEHKIDVRAGTAVLAPRTVRLSVTRVASLTEAARAFEARAPIGYDAAMRDIAAQRTGEEIMVEGEVVEARGTGHSTVVLIDDRRGCSKGPCVVRVVVGRPITLAHGEPLRAYGRVARAYRTPSAQTVPEVEAEFVLRAKP
jgi:hypothetical protein